MKNKDRNCVSCYHLGDPQKEEECFECGHDYERPNYKPMATTSEVRDGTDENSMV